ncbi:hypothetical protein RchiOBHm_Chr6g0253241 [Rosa chinensis]|uniref:Uncharacterized protein n=1 Tax=Rosa chinensis TaxID=74649 RepID=A0A2P6PL93_ROSCH|nr:hypothetical protein RchiOBHm_Chr6g0253241 [Rosa chinensis]
MVDSVDSFLAYDSCINAVITAHSSQLFLGCKNTSCNRLHLVGPMLLNLDFILVSLSAFPSVIRERLLLIVLSLL